MSQIPSVSPSDFFRKGAFVSRVAIFISTVLLTQTVFGYQTISNFWEGRAKAVALKNSKWPKRIPAPVHDLLHHSSKTQKIPSPILSVFPTKIFSHLNLKDVFLPDEKNPVLIIEDVHLNQEAQNHIFAALKTIGEVQDGAPVQVGVEGAEGAFYYDAYRNGPFPDLAQKAAAEFFQNGKISGPAYAGLGFFPDKPQRGLAFHGIEDRGLYQENVQAYLDGKEIKETLQASLSKSIDLFKRESALHGDDFFNLVQSALLFDEEKLPLSDYAERLLSRGSLQSYPQVGKFLQAIRLERSLNFDQVEETRKRYFSDLSSKLSIDQQNQLINLTLAYKEGQLSSSEFLQLIRVMGERVGTSLKQYPEYERYVGYVLSVDEVDPALLWKEIPTLEEDAFLSSAPPSLGREKIENFLANRLGLKLTDLSLTPAQWALWKKSYRDRLEKRKNWTAFERFYDVAERRNDQFLSQTLLLKEKGPVVLTVGGFHTEGLTTLFEKEKISYLVGSPKLSQISSGKGSEYLSFFDREKASVNELAKGKKLFLSPPRVGARRPLLPGSFNQFQALVKSVMEKKASGQTESVSEAHSWLRDLGLSQLIRAKNASSIRFSFDLFSATLAVSLSVSLARWIWGNYAIFLGSGALILAFGAVYAYYRHYKPYRPLLKDFILAGQEGKGREKWIFQHRRALKKAAAISEFGSRLRNAGKTKLGFIGFLDEKALPRLSDNVFYFSTEGILPTIPKEEVRNWALVVNEKELDKDSFVEAFSDWVEFNNLGSDAGNQSVFFVNVETAKITPYKVGAPLPLGGTFQPEDYPSPSLNVFGFGRLLAFEWKNPGSLKGVLKRINVNIHFKGPPDAWVKLAKKIQKRVSPRKKGAELVVITPYHFAGLSPWWKESKALFEFAPFSVLTFPSRASLSPYLRLNPGEEKIFIEIQTKGREKETGPIAREAREKGYPVLTVRVNESGELASQLIAQHGWLKFLWFYEKFSKTSRDNRPLLFLDWPAIFLGVGSLLILEQFLRFYSASFQGLLLGSFFFTVSEEFVAQVRQAIKNLNFGRHHTGQPELPYYTGTKEATRTFISRFLGKAISFFSQGGEDQEERVYVLFNEKTGLRETVSINVQLGSLENPAERSILFSKAEGRGKFSPFAKIDLLPENGKAKARFFIGSEDMETLGFPILRLFFETSKDLFQFSKEGTFYFEGSSPEAIRGRAETNFRGLIEEAFSSYLANGAKRPLLVHQFGGPETIYPAFHVRFYETENPLKLRYVLISLESESTVLGAGDISINQESSSLQFSFDGRLSSLDKKTNHAYYDGFKKEFPIYVLLEVLGKNGLVNLSDGDFNEENSPRVSRSLGNRLALALLFLALPSAFIYLTGTNALGTSSLLFVPSALFAFQAFELFLAAIFKRWDWSRSWARDDFHWLLDRGGALFKPFRLKEFEAERVEGGQTYYNYPLFQYLPVFLQRQILKEAAYHHIYQDFFNLSLETSRSKTSLFLEEVVVNTIFPIWFLIFPDDRIDRLYEKNFNEWFSTHVRRSGQSLFVFSERNTGDLEDLIPSLLDYAPENAQFLLNFWRLIQMSPLLDDPIILSQSDIGWASLGVQFSQSGIAQVPIHEATANQNIFSGNSLREEALNLAEVSLDSLNLISTTKKLLNETEKISLSEAILPILDLRVLDREGNQLFVETEGQFTVLSSETKVLGFGPKTSAFWSRKARRMNRVFVFGETPSSLRDLVGPLQILEVTNNEIDQIRSLTDAENPPLHFNQTRNIRVKLNLSEARTPDLNSIRRKASSVSGYWILKEKRIVRVEPVFSNRKWIDFRNPLSGEVLASLEFRFSSPQAESGILTLTARAVRGYEPSPLLSVFENHLINAGWGSPIYNGNDAWDGEFVENTSSFSDSLKETDFSKNFSKLISPFQDKITDLPSGLSSLLRDLDLTQAKINALSEKFVADVHAGLENHGKESSLAMFHTFSSPPTGLEEGRFISIDWGGTNGRLDLWEVKGKSQIALLSRSKKTFSIEEKADPYSILEGFSEEIKTLVDAYPDIQGVALVMGFPLDLKDDGSAILTGWVKEGWTDSSDEKRQLVGKDVVTAFKENLKSQGLERLKVFQPNNDTLDPLFTIGYVLEGLQNGQDGINQAFVLGTGFNVVANYGNGNEIRNLEAGRFSNLDSVLTEVDRLVDKESSKPGNNPFEKLISGDYLGEVVRTGLQLLAREEPRLGRLAQIFAQKGSLSTQLLSTILNDTKEDEIGVLLPVTALTLKELGLDSNEEERLYLRLIAQAVVLRSFRLVGMTLASNIQVMERNEAPHYQVIPGEGTLFERFPGAEEMIREGMRWVLGRDRVKRVHLVLNQLGPDFIQTPEGYEGFSVSGAGAAINAASKTREKSLRWVLLLNFSFYSVMVLALAFDFPSWVFFVSLIFFSTYFIQFLMIAFSFWQPVKENLKIIEDYKIKFSQSVFPDLYAGYGLTGLQINKPNFLSLPYLAQRWFLWHEKVHSMNPALWELIVSLTDPFTFFLALLGWVPTFPDTNPGTNGEDFNPDEGPTPSPQLPFSKRIQFLDKYTAAQTVPEGGNFNLPLFLLENSPSGSLLRDAAGRYISNAKTQDNETRLVSLGLLLTGSENETAPVSDLMEQALVQDQPVATLFVGDLPGSEEEDLGIIQATISQMREKRGALVVVSQSQDVGFNEKIQTLLTQQSFPTSFVEEREIEAPLTHLPSLFALLQEKGFNPAALQALIDSDYQGGSLMVFTRDPGQFVQQNAFAAAILHLLTNFGDGLRLLGPGQIERTLKAAKEALKHA